MNYRRVRESCERIANVLGININPATMSSLSEIPKTNHPQTVTSAFNHVKTPTDYLSPNK